MTAGGWEAVSVGNALWLQYRLSTNGFISYVVLPVSRSMLLKHRCQDKGQDDNNKKPKFPVHTVSEGSDLLKSFGTEN